MTLDILMEHEEIIAYSERHKSFKALHREIAEYRSGDPRDIIERYRSQQIRLPAADRRIKEMELWRPVEKTCTQGPYTLGDHPLNGFSYEKYMGDLGVRR